MFCLIVLEMKIETSGLEMKLIVLDVACGYWVVSPVLSEVSDYLVVICFLCSRMKPEKGNEWTSIQVSQQLARYLAIF